MPASEQILYEKPMGCQRMRIFSVSDQWDVSGVEYSLRVTNGMPADVNILFE
jgi:hypothetical protein